MSDGPIQARDLSHWNFSASEVIELTGVSSGTLQNWLARGVIQLGEKRRRGPHRIYSFPDVTMIAVAAALTRLRVPPSVINNIYEDVRKRAFELFLGWLVSPNLEYALGEIEPFRPEVLLLHPDIANPDNWYVLQAEWDEERDFDPSVLPDTFIVLKLDKLIGRILEAAEVMKPSATGGYNPIAAQPAATVA